MPRAGGRGGKREGTPGKAYPNRSDLTQAPSAAPGQDYGQAAAQLRAQQTAPLPKQGPLPLAPAGNASAGPSPPAGAAPGTPTVLPGGLGPLHAPSQNPSQPLTAGLSSGPGPGPEALQPPDPLTKAAAILNTLGGVADPLTQALRNKINATLNNRGAA